MRDDFFDGLEMDDDEENDELQTPDWMGFDDDEQQPEEESDTFDILRQKSARAGSAFDELSDEDTFDNNQSSSSSFSLQGLTPSQRTILAVLLLLNVIVIVVAFVLLIQ